MKSVEVSDGFPIRHVGLQWVSDQACRSPMGLQLGMSVSNRTCRSPIENVEVSGWGISVSDGFLMGRFGLRWVSDGACWF